MTHLVSRLCDAGMAWIKRDGQICSSLTNVNRQWFNGCVPTGDSRRIPWFITAFWRKCPPPQHRTMLTELPV